MAIPKLKVQVRGIENFVQEVANPGRTGGQVAIEGVVHVLVRARFASSYPPTWTYKHNSVPAIGQ